MRVMRFVKTDDDIFLNQRQILWVKAMNDCLEVCMKSDGCTIDKWSKNTHSICKKVNPDNYNKLACHWE